MDERLYERLDALIDVLNRIERRLGQLPAQSAGATAAPIKDPSLRAIVRRWSEERALAVSAADVDALLDSCAWDAKNLSAELDRLSKKLATQPARSLRRLQAK